MTQCTSTTGAKSDSDHGLEDLALGRVVRLDRGDRILGRSDPAEGVRVLLRGVTLDEDRGVARVRDALDDVIAGGEQAGVGGGRIESEQDGAALHLRNHVGDTDPRARSGTAMMTTSASATAVSTSVTVAAGRLAPALAGRDFAVVHGVRGCAPGCSRPACPSCRPRR